MVVLSLFSIAGELSFSEKSVVEHERSLLLGESCYSVRAPVYSDFIQLINYLDTVQVMCSRLIYDSILVESKDAVATRRTWWRWINDILS